MIRDVVVNCYCSVQETARLWGNSVRWVNQYALDGRIPGAGATGQILVDSERRVQTGEVQIRAKAERTFREK